MAKSTRFTRQELYEMVWAEPISRIATRLGASDVAISKICGKMKVPRPPRGHWARVLHGYRVRQPKLPDPDSDTPTEWLLTPQGSRPKWNPQTAETPEIEMPVKLGRPHRELTKVKATLKGIRKDDYGRVCSTDQVLHVTPQSVSRCIRILTVLFRALEKRGHSINYEDEELSVWVGGEQMRLSLYEPTKRIPHPNPSDWGYPKWAYIATGRLTLTLSAPRFYRIKHQWSDTARNSLEEKLGEIAIAMENVPSLISEEREARNIREVREARSALVRQRRYDQHRLTHERAESIRKLSTDWRLASQIRTLAAAINNEESAPPASKRLARWGTKYADHLDPLKQFRIVALDEKPIKSHW